MDTLRLGIIMNGVTGRMGTNQHLCARSRDSRARRGARRRAPRDARSHLIGRNAAKLESLACANGVSRWSTDLDAALADKNDTVYFDSASTGLRPALIGKAIAAEAHLPRNRSRRR